MPVILLVFEFLGTTELLVIATVALLVFGPRKLPEIGRTIGRALAEFRRASEDFKRTWEYEVEMERSSMSDTNIGPAGAASRAALPEGDSASASAWDSDGGALAATEEQTIARQRAGASASPVESDDATRAAEDADDQTTEESSTTGDKKDWL